MPEKSSYALDGIDRLIHEKARLSILSSLAAHPAGLVFTDLKDLCRLTDGNLSRHLTILQEARLISIHKSFQNNRPQTIARLSPLGQKRFTEYLTELEQIVSSALKSKRHPAPTPVRPKPA